MSAATGTPLAWWKLLPLNTLHCPKDKAPLHWELFASMRLRHQAGTGHVYHARCPQCGKDYDVLAPKTKE